MFAAMWLSRHARIPDSTRTGCLPQHPGSTQSLGSTDAERGVSWRENGRREAGPRARARAHQKHGRGRNYMAGNVAWRSRNGAVAGAAHWAPKADG